MNPLKLILLAVLGAGAIVASAQCHVNLSAATMDQIENVPEQTQSYLLNRLQGVLSANGVNVDPSMTRFFIAGRFSHVSEDVVPGPPMQTAIHTNLTLYIGDNQNKTIYASTTLDLRGVGTSLHRAYINALRTVNANNPAIRQFISAGRKKIVSFYDANYPQIISRAERAASQHRNDEALWLLNQIPECCKGYDEAASASSRYFQSYINQLGMALLKRAQGAWASGHNEAAANQAFFYLEQINPESNAFAAARKLAAEISASVKSDRDFQLRKTHDDVVDLEKRRIQAAADVGVAFGNGQQPSTTHITWIQ